MIAQFATQYQRNVYKCQGCVPNGYCTKTVCFKVGNDLYCNRHVRDYAETLPTSKNYNHPVLHMTRTTRARLTRATLSDTTYSCQCSGTCNEIVKWKVRGEVYCDNHICEYVDVPLTHSSYY